jgi:putative ABC transport system permease protein
MMYINNFLIKRRKKEFGLYGILGLDKRHIGRVLIWENLFVIGGGLPAALPLRWCSGGCCS